jgi:hypothetical protein
VPGDSGVDLAGGSSSTSVPIAAEDLGTGIVYGCNTLNGKKQGGESDKGRILFTLVSELASDEGGRRRTSALYCAATYDDNCAKGNIFSSKMTS